jgi:hypothetical protein
MFCFICLENSDIDYSQLFLSESYTNLSSLTLNSILPSKFTNLCLSFSLFLLTYVENAWVTNIHIISGDNIKFKCWSYAIFIESTNALGPYVIIGLKFVSIILCCWILYLVDKCWSWVLTACSSDI